MPAVNVFVVVQDDEGLARPAAEDLERDLADGDLLAVRGHRSYRFHLSVDGTRLPSRPLAGRMLPKRWRYYPAALGSSIVGAAGLGKAGPVAPPFRPWLSLGDRGPSSIRRRKVLVS